MFFNKKKVKRPQRHYSAQEAKQMTKDGIKIKFAQSLDFMYSEIEHMSKLGLSEYALCEDFCTGTFIPLVKDLIIDDLKMRGYSVKESEKEKKFPSYCSTDLHTYKVKCLIINW